MQDKKKMDMKPVKDFMKERANMAENKESLTGDHSDHQAAIDTGAALQRFLDRIPISSIPGLRNSPVLELKTGDSVREAIQLLYEKNIYGAPILDLRDLDPTIGRFSDRYIGFIDFASMVLWSLEECEKGHIQIKGSSRDETVNRSFFTLLEQNPQIAQTKVGELAKSSLWDPFFPVHLEDTLFHVLLLLSKHPVQALPVIDEPSAQVIGFVTQHAVIHLLLQSDGLEWFDDIADKALSEEFRLESEEHVTSIYADESVAEALCTLWRSQLGVVAVTDRKTQRLIGSISRSHIYLLLENDDLLHNMKSITLEEFIQMETSKGISNLTVERDIGALLNAGVLRLRNSFLPRMDSPVTNQKRDSLKQAMKQLAETNSSFSFLVDDSQRAKGVLTLRDVIIQFAPPCIDSSIHGSSFFDSALEQTGCHVKNGTITS